MKPSRVYWGRAEGNLSVVPLIPGVTPPVPGKAKASWPYPFILIEKLLNCTWLSSVTTLLKKYIFNAVFLCLLDYKNTYKSSVSCFSIGYLFISPDCKTDFCMAWQCFGPAPYLPICTILNWDSILAAWASPSHVPKLDHWNQLWGLWGKLSFALVSSDGPSEGSN